MSSTIREHRRLYFNDFRRICKQEGWCTSCTPGGWELFRAFLNQDMDVVKIEKLAHGVISRSEIDWTEYDSEENCLLVVMAVLANEITTTYTLM